MLALRLLLRGQARLQRGDEESEIVMAADRPLGVTSMDSKEDVMVVCATDRGGALVYVPGEPTTLRMYDNRGRCVDLVSNVRGLRLALMNLPACECDADESTTGGLCDICGLDRGEDVEELIEDRNTLAAELMVLSGRLRTLHPKRYPAFQGTTTCGTCGSPWPCATLEAIGVNE